MTPIEALDSIIDTFYDKNADDIKIVRATLKEKEKQDKMLDFLKEHIVFEDGVVKANFQWIIDDKETEEAVKEWLK